MSLLDLAIKVGVDDQATGGLEKIANYAKSGFTTALKVGAAAVTAAATAVTVLTKQSVEAYANYEQLTGGIETLFGVQGKTLKEYADSVGKDLGDCVEEWSNYYKAQETVMKNSSDAWLKQGMDANTYLETAMSFSASLIASVAGDTQKAADMTDRIMTDIADNANKFGTSQETVMNAYKGFAKQNYTMLDNLSLGYAGTKEGAEQLVKAAAALTKEQGQLGVTIDENSLSFDNLANAISVIQLSMGITGTTTKEAMYTISGSINAMKAAWTNLLIGLGDDTADIQSLVGNLVTSLIGTGEGGGVLNNLLPRINAIFKGIGEAMIGLAPIVSTTLPGLISEGLPMFVAAIQGLVDAAVAVFPTLIDTVLALVPTIMDSGLTIISSLASTLIENAPQLVSSALQIILMFASYLADNASNIVTGTVALLSALVSGIVSILPALPGIALQLVKGLVDGIVAATTELATAAVTLISDFASYITENKESIGTSAGELLASFVNWIVTNASEMYKATIAILSALVNGLIAIIPALPGIALSIITSFVEGLKANGENIKSCLSEIWTAAKTAFTGAVALGAAIINNILAGMRSVIDALVGWFSGVWADIEALGTNAWTNISNAWTAATSFFSSLFTGIYTAASTALLILISYFTAAWDSVTAVFSNALDIGKQIVDNIKSGISNKWEELKSWISEQWATIKSIFTVSVDFSKIQYQGADGSDLTSHAKGNRYVPYDQISQLHRGEIVLTRSEADKYGNNEGGNGNGTTVNFYAQTINKSDLDMIWDYVDLQGGLA